MFARTKGQVHYDIRSYIPFTNNKCHVTNIYTVEKKQQYHITFFCEKNKSIILQ